MYARVGWTSPARGTARVATDSGVALGCDLLRRSRSTLCKPLGVRRRNPQPTWWFDMNRFTLFTLLLFASCSEPSADPGVYAFVETIQAACSGGIAGTIRVVTVHRDGRVEYRLRGVLAGRSGPDSVTKAQADAWFAALENARFFSHQSPKREPVADGFYCGIALPWLDTTHKGVERLTNRCDRVLGFLAQQDVPPVSPIKAVPGTK